MHARLAGIRNARLPRDLHPVAWWIWALGLATAATFTTNPYILLLLIGVACLTVAARRSAQPWADSFRLYLWLGVAIIVMRVVAKAATRRSPRTWSPTSETASLRPNL